MPKISRSASLQLQAYDPLPYYMAGLLRGWCQRGIMADCSTLGLLMEAVNFAAIKHKDQRRKDAEKTPYINHPIGVAFILWKEGGVEDLAVIQVTNYSSAPSLGQRNGNGGMQILRDEVRGVCVGGQLHVTPQSPAHSVPMQTYRL